MTSLLSDTHSGGYNISRAYFSLHPTVFGVHSLTAIPITMPITGDIDSQMSTIKYKYCFNITITIQNLHVIFSR